MLSKYEWDQLQKLYDNGMREWWDDKEKRDARYEADGEGWKEEEEKESKA